MANQVKPPEPVDLTLLDNFLLSDAAPEDAMGISDLDGFLTGIAAGPEPIPQGEWLAVIWGGEGPRFESPGQAQAVIGVIMARYDEILYCLDRAPERFDPIFWEGPQGQAIVGDWAGGFLDAMRLRAPAWQILLGHDEAGVLLMPLLTFGVEDPEDAPFGVEALSEQERENLAEEVAEIIPECVIGIHAFWKEHRQGLAGARAASGKSGPARGVPPRRAH